MQSQLRLSSDEIRNTNRTDGHDDSLRIGTQNEHGPIFNLPADVLLEIFLLLRDSCAVGDWLPISHVCRAWREVALGAATLWNEPPTHLHDLTLSMLERSRMADLIVYVTEETSAATVTALMGQIHRIRLLSFIQSPQLLENACDILRTSVQQALRLENITITSHVTHMEPVLASSSISFAHLPRLRHVDFGHIQFNWEALPLSTLSSLSLVNTVLPARVYIKRFLEILAQMTDLEKFTVSTWSASLPQYHYDDDPDPDVGLKAVQLPKLSFILFLILDQRQLEFLFSIMSMPQLRFMNIAIKDMDLDLASLFRTISSAVPKGAFGNFSTMVIGGRLLQFSNVPQDPDSERLPLTSLTIGSTTDIGFLLDDFAVEGVLGLDSRILSTVVSLSFHDHIPSEHLLQTCATHVHGLKYITLPITRIRHLADIRQLENESVDPPAIGLPFPHLVSIVVTGSNQPEDEATWADVVDCVRVRKSFGFPLLLLGLKNSVTRPSITVLKALLELDVDVKRFRF